MNLDIGVLTRALLARVMQLEAENQQLRAENAALRDAQQDEPAQRVNATD